MNNGLVRSGPRSAETGEFGVDAVAPQNIGGRYRLAALLVGHRALDDRPVDATGEVVLDRINHILEATIDNRFERVEPLLRFLPRRLLVSSLPSIVTARRALAACTAVTPPASPIVHPNILLITIDTLRADRIGKGFTPTLDRLASQGARFTAARSVVPSIATQRIPTPMNPAAKEARLLLWK